MSECMRRKLSSRLLLENAMACDEFSLQDELDPSDQGDNLACAGEAVHGAATRSTKLPQAIGVAAISLYLKSRRRSKRPDDPTAHNWAKNIL